MATKRIPDIPCWVRRFVSEVEMIALLNATRPEFERFRASDPVRIKPNSYGEWDREKIEPLWAKA